MVILITGASHTGKTVLSQKMLEKYKYPYLSIDHLKMGLIRSGNTELNAMSSDESLTEYLWPIVREIIKTAIENKQNLIVEGCYIPPDFEKDFSGEHLGEISLICLVMTEKYIRTHFEDIKKHENAIEKRCESDFSIEEALEDNRVFFEKAKKLGINCVMIDDEYRIEF